MRSFFVFCVSNGWLASNPMDGLKKPLVPQTAPADYFNREEFKRLVNATYEYEYGGGHDCRCPCYQAAVFSATDALEWFGHQGRRHPRA